LWRLAASSRAPTSSGGGWRAAADDLAGLRQMLQDLRAARAAVAGVAAEGG
jgi:hypothetical protein